MSDTIFALSSGAPPAAIAIVRISGPAADGALEALAGKLPEPRRATLLTLRSSNEVLDQAVVVRFPAPDSATGEDVVELHLHGGRAVVAAVLDALAETGGLRPAEPGEFTRRAFLNGRVDLAEAEGLADLLAAETQAQRRSALGLAGGALSRQVEQWQRHILDLSAELEAALDFSDEDDVAIVLPARWRERVAAAAAELELLLQRPTIERLRDGIRVVIAGPPNAGKSSLLNVLAGREAAITSDVPGTTRDLVEAPTAVGGTHFLLVDTAGLRDGGDPVEKIGVERAQDAVAAADLVLWLGAAADVPDPGRTIRVHAKADISRPDPSDVSVSAVTGSGIGQLAGLLLARSKNLLPRENELAINRRHQAVLSDCLSALREAEGADDPLIATEALRQARAGLDRITGRAGVEDMLDALFGRFCIGK